MANDRRTAEVLASMFVENTGRHLLDSGDAYGRSWQRNQKAVAAAHQEPVDYFLAQDKVTMTAGRRGMDVTVDAFHWLLDRLEVTDESEHIDKLFHRWCDLCDPDSPWLDSMESFVDLVKRGRHQDGNDYMTGTFNTYNGECSLSQTLQGTIFFYDDEPYILLQVHGGCDVRGGYTKPRVLSIATDPGDLYDWDAFTIACTAEPQPDPSPELPGMPKRPVESPHVWDCRNAEWVEYGGAYTRNPWKDAGRESVATDEDGEYFVACPRCGAPMVAYEYPVG